jgi:ribosomal protein S18 acetylase RimI-like enzyme
MSITVTVHDELPPEATVIDTGLGEANAAAAPLEDVQALACLASDDAGRVIGGAIGRTWGACCELQQLWVEPAHRRRGIAARLVREFELRAEARGARTFYLETFSFQAPGLYRSLGYSERLALHGFAPGIVKYTMVRELDGASTSPPR